MDELDILIKQAVEYDFMESELRDIVRNFYQALSNAPESDARSRYTAWLADNWESIPEGQGEQV